MRMSLDIASLLETYARGALSPVDVINAIYDDIDAYGERPVWITLAPRAQALAKVASAPKGALFGIPFAVKDNIDVAGLPTTCACPAFAYTPAHSAFVVEQLEAAGAILIGKTNLDQFATGLVGTRSPYGIPSSVFNEDYISGGSSSGSAVAVAKGLVSFALGTDTAGSGRVPAAFNNIVGLKATKGLISTRGVVPACKTQDVVSIFALTVRDASVVAGVATSFDVKDPFARQCGDALAVMKPSRPLRVGTPANGLEFFGDLDYERLYRDAVARAADLGAEIVEVDFRSFRDAASLLYSGPWVAERLAAIETFAESHADAMHDVVRSIVLGAKHLSAVETFKGHYRLAELIRSAEAEWGKIDVLLLPTAGTTYSIAQVQADPVCLNSNLGAYTNFVNLMDLSALAVPAGFRPDGIPFGVTLIARAFQDGLIAAFGDALHRSLKNIQLGATAKLLSGTPPVPAPDRKRSIEVAVVGAHLTGQPLNHQLSDRGARLVRTARTSGGYSFYSLANTSPPKPGLVFDGRGAGGIEVEVWEMDAAAFGSFVALIPAPLGIGTVTLDDGSAVKGFLCEAHAVQGAEDITAWGGWRAWRCRGVSGDHRSCTDSERYTR
jgi:allophanate hydrolase